MGEIGRPTGPSSSLNRPKCTNRHPRRAPAGACARRGCRAAHRSHRRLTLSRSNSSTLRLKTRCVVRAQTTAHVHGCTHHLAWLVLYRQLPDRRKPHVYFVCIHEFHDKFEFLICLFPFLFPPFFPLRCCVVCARVNDVSRLHLPLHPTAITCLTHRLQDAHTAGFIPPTRSKM